MLFVTTCCIYKSTSYIYFFNKLQRKMYIFHTNSGFKRSNISKKYQLELYFFFTFQKSISQASRDPSSTSKLGRNSLYNVLKISYFGHSSSNISGQQCFPVFETFIMYSEFILAFQLQIVIYETESERFRWVKEKRHLNEWFSR